MMLRLNGLGIYSEARICLKLWGRQLKKKEIRNLLLSVVFVTALTPVHAQAQSIDYSSLETLFGEPVTTDATGKPQRVSEAPVDMEIITQDDIRKSGARTIAEALRGVPGVNVQQSARQDYDIGIRGYNQAYAHNILVLVNGRQVYLDDYGYTNWASIPVQLAEIRQIEIVKGPNTALFGFNAADGVINIVTMNPLYDNVSTVGGAVGTGEYRDANLVKSVKVNDDVGIRISAGASASNDFSDSVNSAEPQSVFTSPQKEAINIDSLFQVTPKSQIRVEASSSQAIQSDMTAFSFLTEDKYETSSLKTDYEADTPYGLVKATAYKNWLDTYFNGDLYDPGLNGENVSNNVTVAQLSDTFKLGVSNTFRIGGEYRHNVADGPVIGPIGATLQEDVYALSGMWDWAINNAWDWTNSARIDRLDLSRSGPLDPSVALLMSDGNFDRSITKPSYNSGLVWKATPDDSFRVNTARGLRMASLFDFGASIHAGAAIGPFPVIVAGNPQDNPTSVTSYEAGWDHKLKPIDGSFKADVFTEKTANALPTGGNLIACPVPLNGALPIACTSTGSEVVVQSANVGSSEDVGAEFDLKGKFDQNWSWGVNDTVEKIYNHEVDPTVNTLAETPVNLTNVHLGYQNGAWESDAFVYYNTRFQEPEPGADFTAPTPLVTMPAHVSLSARVGYKLNDVTTVALSGESLQQENSLTSTGLETARQVFLSLQRNF